MTIQQHWSAFNPKNKKFCLFVFVVVFRKKFKGILQNIEVGAGAEDEERVPHGPDDLIGQHVVGEESEEVADSTSNIQSSSEEEG